VIYLRSVRNIPLPRLTDLLRDLLGLEISEGNRSEGAILLAPNDNSPPI